MDSATLCSGHRSFSLPISCFMLGSLYCFPAPPPPPPPALAMLVPLPLRFGGLLFFRAAATTKDDEQADWAALAAAESGLCLPLAFDLRPAWEDSEVEVLLLLVSLSDSDSLPALEELPEPDSGSDSVGLSLQVLSSSSSSLEDRRLFFFLVANGMGGAAPPPPPPKEPRLFLMTLAGGLVASMEFCLPEVVVPEPAPSDSLASFTDPLLGGSFFLRTTRTTLRTPRGTATGTTCDLSTLSLEYWAPLVY
ncbi:uncharacterized protein LOC120322405 [Drosophila yakuba]|uniref:uncharacterized protein LOC120322405 n=1 Tax=Drosophila yakuba TaxID=7245 RepID=UPI001930831A|nr:uncharacterized protein LOC120322405 [Drosophila yakuba]